MKKTTLSTFRKMKKNAVLLVLTGLLVAVGSAFFVTLFTITQGIEDTAAQYSIDYAYADCTYYGSFTDSSVALAADVAGIDCAEGRYVIDSRSTDATIVYRAISLTENINKLYIFSGRLPINAGECAINRLSADAMGIKLGDTVNLGGKLGSAEVTAFVASPEYVYMVKNERSPFTDPGAFATLYLTEDSFSGEFNEILVLGKDKKALNSVGAKVSSSLHILREDQVNDELGSDQQKKIKIFAYIFPIIFVVMIFVAVFVIMRRIAKKEQTQIAVYKSLGASNASVIFIYIRQFIFVFIFAALLGSLIAMPITSFILKIFSKIFLIPILSYRFYPLLWAIAVFAGVILCIVPGVLSFSSLLKKRPSEIMRPDDSKDGGKKTLLERMPFIWKRLSFNSRYALKSMLRSKGRFFAIVAGITATVALTMLSLGFYNSLMSVQSKYFGGFTNYDMTVWYGYSPLPLSASLEFEGELDILTSASKALSTRAVIKGDSCLITVAENGFDKFKIDKTAVLNGIIIPSYHAKLWKVKTGDVIRLTIPVGELSFYKDCVVSGIAAQSLALNVFTSYDYLFGGNPLVPKLYNAVYLKGGDLTGVKDFLNAGGTASYSTIDDDKDSFKAVTDSLTILIFFLIICALILGIAVLYSVGIINLNARENEYMLLSTLGYRHSKIMQAYLKESFIQMLLSIPLGFLLGYLLLIVIKNAFSSASFVMFASVFWWTYLFTAFMVLSLTAIMTVIVSFKVKRLNIVEGLKSQE